MRTRQASKCQSFPLSLKGGGILVDKAEVYLLDHTSDRDLHHWQLAFQWGTQSLCNWIRVLCTELMRQKVPCLLSKHLEYLPVNKYLFNFFSKDFFQLLKSISYLTRMHLIAHASAVYQTLLKTCNVDNRNYSPGLGKRKPRTYFSWRYPTKWQLMTTCWPPFS